MRQISKKSAKKCWGSLFNERAIIYRIKKGIPHLEGIAGIVQEMISAEVSGIMFTVHPSDQKILLVEVSYGIDDIIVSGKVQPDDFVVDKETLEITEKTIGNKSKMSICKSGEIKVVDVEIGLAKKQVIPDEEVKQIAKICLKVEGIFNYPQDIEWCVSEDKVWMLQSRTVTGGIK